MEKGSSQKSPCSRDSRECRDFRDSRDSSSEKTPFVVTPSSVPEEEIGCDTPPPCMRTSGAIPFLLEGYLSNTCAMPYEVRKTWRGDTLSDHHYRATVSHAMLPIARYLRTLQNMRYPPPLCKVGSLEGGPIHLSFRRLAPVSQDMLVLFGLHLACEHLKSEDGKGWGHKRGDLKTP